MFREAFPENFRDYARACKAGEVATGRMFVHATGKLSRPRWLVDFPTNQHWRNPSRIEWIITGLADLRRVNIESGIRSIAIPPLGGRNGGLDWRDVRPEIQRALGELDGVEAMVFEPTEAYQ